MLDVAYAYGPSIAGGEKTLKLCGIPANVCIHSGYSDFDHSCHHSVMTSGLMSADADSDSKVPEDCANLYSAGKPANSVSCRVGPTYWYPDGCSVDVSFEVEL